MRSDKKPRPADRAPTAASASDQGTPYCSIREGTPRVMAPTVTADRASLILSNGSKWVNGTVLHYYFFDREPDHSIVTLQDGSQRSVTWVGAELQRQLVRKSFDAWLALGIGVQFKEVPRREDAEIRIGFMAGDGSWSYIGRDVLLSGADERTMNIGWDLRLQPDTAVHEIGHSLGFPHEHQNPISGIVWDEEAVYSALAGPPNRWDRDKTYRNIIRKNSADTVQGSSWDPDSVMEYPFEAGLIRSPEAYRGGLRPAGGLSARDRAWARSFYPPISDAGVPRLQSLVSTSIVAESGGQDNFEIVPSETRYYDLRTFGAADVVMVLFEEVNGELEYRSGADDGGTEDNATMRVKLIEGRRYVLRIRVYHRESSQNVAVMMW